MGRKKRKQKEQEQNNIVWCYYCDRQFADEATLIQHQKAKHFKCESCGKKLSGISGLTIHASQVHKINMSLVPNAKPGRDSVQKEVFGMAGVPPGMRPGGDFDEQAAKRVKFEAQQQPVLPGMSGPIQPPFTNPPLLFNSAWNQLQLQPKSFPQNPALIPGYGGSVMANAAPPTVGYPPPFPQPSNLIPAPPIPGFGMPPGLIPGQILPHPMVGFPPPGSGAPPPMPPPMSGQLNNSINTNGMQPQPLFPVSQTSNSGQQVAVAENSKGRSSEQQVVVQDKVLWQEEDLSPEEKRAMGPLYRSYLKAPPVSV
eukprot:TRINITY_DN12624_c0_g1_i2.p1 TRINITY_DN12624_c0_g1~~TRINITY_DN12624_c0_g1_i2.p1  ORF type:complete len:350 (-),score=50.21 TRINITY_DN12624_c0_g1_i2:317-1252(-)